MESFYRHTQTGTVILVVLAGAAAIQVLAFWLLASEGVLLPMGIIVLVAFLFGSLTVDVDHDRVLCWFGPGWIRRRIPLAEIKDVKAVRNTWLFGWGIRYIGKGWMFNVAGLNAVELTLASGKRFRIGTDEPAELEAAIWRALSLPE